MPIRTALIWCLLLALSCAGCGFQFKGQRPLPASLDNIYIEYEQSYTTVEPPLIRALRSRLNSLGKRVPDDKRAADSVLRIIDLAEDRQLLSVSAVGGDAAEFQIVSEVSFELLQDGEVTVPRQSLRSKRDYSFDSSEILSNEAEQQQLRESIQEELADLILIRMESELKRKKS